MRRAGTGPELLEQLHGMLQFIGANVLNPVRLDPRSHCGVRKGKGQ